MASFQKVALLGKGFLGTNVLEQLSKAGFTVTVLSRNPSAITGLPSGASAVAVDYTSQDSVVEALRGHQVVVSTLGFAGIPGQKAIIDASILAGVKRFVPSDWGSITTDPSAKDFPINAQMIEIQDYLKEKAKEGSIEYTIFSVGAWFNYVVNSPFMFNVETHSADLYDQGAHPFSSTTVSGVGRAVAGALKVPEESKNRNLLIHEAVLTQAKVVELAKKYSPSSTSWTENHIDASKELSEALESFKGNPTDFGLLYRLLKAAIIGGKYRAAYSKVDNELVGVPVLTDAQIEQQFASIFKERKS